MPKEQFIHHTSHKRKKELADTLREYPELKEIRASVVWPLSQDKKDFLEMLRRFSGERRQVSEKDMNTLKELLSTKDNMRIRAAASFIAQTAGIFNEGQKQELLTVLSGAFVLDKDEYSTLLEEIKQAKSSLVQNENLKDANSHTGSSKIAPERVNEWLLGSRKAMFSTPETKEVARRLLGAKEALRATQEEFPDVAGVVVVGGIEAGHADKTSDLDFLLLTENSDALSQFKKELKKREIRPCFFLSRISGPPGKLDRGYIVGGKDVFRGIYIGDRTVLRQYQEQILENVYRYDWEKMRQEIATQQTNVYKAIEKLGIESGFAKKVSAASLLTRVPPPLEEAREIFANRNNT